jgi:hypothetical protein
MFMQGYPINHHMPENNKNRQQASVALFYCILIFFVMKPGDLAAQQVTFSKTLGNSAYNQGVASFQLSDSGYVVIGNSNGFSSTTAPYLAWIDQYGNLLADRMISRQWLLKVNSAVMHDSNLYMTGFAYILGSYDFMLIKTDLSGNVLLEKYWGNQGWNFANDLVVDGSSHIYIAGESTDTVYGEMSAVVMCLAPNGAVQWTKTFGGQEYDAFYAIDTGYGQTLVMAGTTASLSASGDSAFYMASTDLLGNILWESVIDEPGTSIAYDIHPDIQGGYILCGETTSLLPDMGQDAVIFKTDLFGNLHWMTPLGTKNQDAFHTVVQLPDSTYRMAGYNAGDFSYGMKDFYFQNATIYGTWGGQQLGSFTIGGQKDDIAFGMIRSLDGGYLLTGTSHSFGYGLSNIYLLKLGDSAQFSPYSGHQTATFEPVEHPRRSHEIYPNPTKNVLNLKLNGNGERFEDAYVSDLTGRVVKRFDPNLFDTSSVELPVDDLPAGVYFLKIGEETLRFIKVQ